MKDKTVKILLGIIAMNLTFLSFKEIGPMQTVYAQHSAPPMKVVVCDLSGLRCADVD